MYQNVWKEWNALIQQRINKVGDMQSTALPTQFQKIQKKIHAVKVHVLTQKCICGTVLTGDSINCAISAEWQNTKIMIMFLTSNSTITKHISG